LAVNNIDDEDDNFVDKNVVNVYNTVFGDAILNYGNACDILNQYIILEHY